MEKLVSESLNTVPWTFGDHAVLTLPWEKGGGISAWPLYCSVRRKAFCWNVCPTQRWAKWRLSTFDLDPGGRGMGCRDKYVDILRPQLAMNRFLPLLATHSHTLDTYVLGGVWGGSDIRSMLSIRPICKCRCPPLALPPPPLMVASCLVTGGINHPPAFSQSASPARTRTPS